MRRIDTCPVCGSPPVYTVKKCINLDRTGGILRGQYLEYNIKLCGESVAKEYFAICGECAAIYRALHFTDDEIKAIYKFLYFDFEKKFQNAIIYNDQKLMDECSVKMYENVKNIEKNYNADIKKIFDIGGRDGFRLGELADNGYDCTVYDPIPQKTCSEKIYKRNIWSNELRKDEKADLIVLCNVLEHSMNPRSLVEDCYAHLDKNGFLFIEIPVDFEAFLDWLLFYQLFKWPLGIDVTHHVFFSKRAINKLLGDGKFAVKKINYNRMPVCGARVMEILAQKGAEQKMGGNKIKEGAGQSLLFFVVSLAEAFPRIALNIAYKSYHKLAKTILGRSRGDVRNGSCHE